MANFIPASATTKKRLEKFHRKCQEACRSKAQFRRSFAVNDYHITAQGLAKNRKRLSLNHEKIAAIIFHGKINEQTSTDDHPIEIAVDGLIKNYEWVDPMTMTSGTEPLVQARVVIREGSPKSFIVTAYILDEITQHDLPEVKLEIWS
jgi:hypothetical protein